MPAPPYVSRINQVDAAQLDQEIYKVLRNQVKEITKYQPVENIDRYQPEIDALLKFFVWNFSLRRGKSTFGQQLLNLHYDNITRPKSVLYLILTIVPAYVRDKVAGTAANQNFKLILDRVASIAQLLDLINLLVFLHRGTQPRAIEYFLGITSRSITVHKPRNIGYSYMTRELLWHGFAELFTVGLPMINFHYVKYKLKQLLSRNRQTNVPRPYPTMNIRTKCAYCKDSPILPTFAGCEHLFCYYCLKAHFTATDEFPCPECCTLLYNGNMRTYEATFVA